MAALEMGLRRLRRGPEAAIFLDLLNPLEQNPWRPNFLWDQLTVVSAVCVISMRANQGGAL